MSIKFQPEHGPADYQRMLMGLLPPGLAWTKRPSSNLARYFLAKGEGLARVEAEVFRLINEANPLTTEAALEDWEKTVGLPDKCVGLAESFEERRGAVLYKLNRPVGQSKAFFLEQCARLGYEAEIEEFPPFEAGVSGAGDAVNCCPAGAMLDAAGAISQNHWDGWSFVWQVKVQSTFVRFFNAGGSLAGDAIREWGNPVVECRLNQIKPAHTYVIFAYKEVPDA